jgi:putative transposase
MEHERKPYPSDLSDAEWEFIKPLTPPEKEGGRPRKTNIREVLNAIFYLLRSGCSWRMLPHDFPHWSTVHTYFRTWRDTGVIERINEMLSTMVRNAVGKEDQPSASIIDRQSVKTTEKGGFTAMMRAKR